MKILSADFMAKISRKAIKELVKSHFRARITDSGAESMAEILEKEAERMSAFAVYNAKKKGRGKITKKDIEEYVIKKGD